MTRLVCAVCSAPARSLRACPECGALLGYAPASRTSEVFETLREGREVDRG